MMSVVWAVFPLVDTARGRAHGDDGVAESSDSLSVASTLEQSNARIIEANGSSVFGSYHHECLQVVQTEEDISN
jgi:hypothetical protein